MIAKMVAVVSTQGKSNALLVLGFLFLVVGESDVPCGSGK